MTKSQVATRTAVRYKSCIAKQDVLTELRGVGVRKRQVLTELRGVGVVKRQVLTELRGVGVVKEHQ